MRRTVYVQTINIIRSPTILANCSCYNTRSYCYGLSPLSSTSVINSALNRTVMRENVLSTQNFRCYNTEVKKVKEENVITGKDALDNIVVTNVTEPVSRKDKLKKAVKEYGSTVIIFHIGISLTSLGASYALVSTGLDVTSLFESIGLKDWFSNSNIATNAGTFAVAYAIHKVFAPVRITITLAAVPFIVRYLRKIGFLKKLN